MDEVSRRAAHTGLAGRILVRETPFAPPPLAVSAQTLRAHFAAVGPRTDTLVRNYHREEPVDPARHAMARPAAVLIGLVNEAEPRLLFTRRHPSISAGGHICFPGGNRDASDRDDIETALRETQEETGIGRESIEPLGILGRYYSHSGHAITPVVALLNPPFEIEPHPHEVDEVVYVPAADAFRPESYELWQHRADHPRAHYSFFSGSARITGPTVCLMMHLYEQLAFRAA